MTSPSSSTAPPERSRAWGARPRHARARAREWIGGLDFIARDEFNAVKAMAVAARDENDALRARIEKLEAALAARGGE